VQQVKNVVVVGGTVRRRSALALEQGKAADALLIEPDDFAV
jgi:hypothetical protein